MPTQTDLSGSPYFDDFNEAENFHKILFKPSVAVQTREVNQLQTILQNQIERFGDNIYKQGTIIDGCNFSYHSTIPYVKIKDIETNGTRVIVDRYKGYYTKNSANLVAEVIEVASGFEATSNTNTLFVNYLNSGDTLDIFSYTADDVLTIYNPAGTLESIAINDGSVGFSNNDEVVILSAISVTNTTGGVAFANSFSPGDTITNTILANAEIVEVDTVSDPASIILRIKPLATDLVSVSANSQWWEFKATDSFSANNGEVGLVAEVLGTSANASLVTSGVGTINRLSVTSGGSGYTIDPTVSIFSHTATVGQVNNLDLDARTYIARVAITPQSSVPVGSGYGVSIDQGIVYQKGNFIRVDPQFLVVARYGEPDGVVVGFMTEEEIITSNINSSLLDNTLGTTNETAPGADRLKLSTTLVVKDKAEAEANSEFLSIIEFSGGEPYQQRKQTQYNIVNDEMSRRMYEESGNFILDEFLLNTKSEKIFADEANSFVAVIDPGTAYINGYRVSTDASYNLSVPKGTDTVEAGVTSSLNYGNYIRIKEVGGVFKFNTGDLINLNSGQKQYLRLNAGSPITSPSGDNIGQARLRSITHESGVPGTRSAIYRLYLFDIKMSSGRNFDEVRSVFYDGVVKAVGDTVTVVDPLTSKTICQLYDSKYNSLVFNNGVRATKSISSESYIYRTVDHSLTANQDGYVVFNAGVNETFPYPSGSLTTTQEADVIVVPLANGISAANLSGSVELFSVNTSVVGVGSNFINELTPGDWINVSNTGTNVVVQIASVGNSTYATLTANASANITSNGAIYFPQFVPVSLQHISRYANVSATANQMTVYIGSALSSDMAVSVAYNIRTTASQVDKTVHRDKFVRLTLSNNEGNTIGPWALGVPDVFRLKSVYIANGASNTLSINAVSDVANTDDFISYPGHRFADGDSLTYVGGTYVIPGLANNTLYYVYGSNSEGFQLSSDNTTPLSINASATNDVSHVFTGSPLYFGPNTTGVIDVTNDYYIDHNQTENYYNTSYLYLVPGATVPSNNSVLLVKFDAFTHSADAGLKHVESYNIDDQVTLENSNTTIHTLEIPQLYSTQDIYYDLRDSVDLRPHVISTANLDANSTTSYTINPTEPDSASKFSGTDKMFPAPESSFVANVEYYVGRVDRIVVDSTGEMRSLKGELGTDRVAPAPLNSLTINILKIPPYPSVPLALSDETIKFADTKIANEKYLFKRLTDYRITPSFTTTDIREEQPRVYRMHDIGTLDRRITDLEYYVALSLAENSAKNRVIPSSIDASLERFKYGFFVDAFNDSTYSDVDHPEYNASVVDGDLIPRYSEMNLEFKFNTANSAISTLVRGGKFISAAHSEYTLINQPVATDGPVYVPPVVNNVPVPEPTPVYSQRLVSVDVVNRTTNYSSSGTEYEDWAFTFSNTAFSPVELFMNCTDNDTAVVIYQSTSSTYQSNTVTTTSQYATPNIAYSQEVKSGGKAYRVGGRTRWENDTGFRNGGPAAAGGLWIEDSYKMSWNHDPSKGKYYLVRVYKGTHLVSPSWDAPRGTYAFRLWYPVDVETGKEPDQTAIQPTAFQYQGTIILEQPTQPALATSVSTISFANVGSLVSNIIGYEFTTYGLKPSTLYKIYLDGVDVTASTILRNVNGLANVTSWINNYPASVPAGYLPSDGYGKMSLLSFRLFSNPSSLLQQNNQLLSSLLGVSQVLICSLDVTPAQLLLNPKAYKNARSYSIANVKIKSYTKTELINNNGIMIPYNAISLSVEDDKQTKDPYSSSTLASSLNYR